MPLRQVLFLRMDAKAHFSDFNHLSDFNQKLGTLPHVNVPALPTSVASLDNSAKPLNLIIFPILSQG